MKRLSLIPVLGVMCCAYLMTSLGWTNWFRFALWMLVGLRIYRLYSFRNSKLNVERIRIAGVSLLSIVPVVIDTILLGFLILPWLRGQDITRPDIVNVLIGFVIGIILEFLTQTIERSRTTTPATA
ncbi:MAG: hypothetical protein JO314_05200 [Acidobacteria bacterium]|nr:hypothetical protein [Acidobacteriota bacterium]